jgi:hypothetical protein
MKKTTLTLALGLCISIGATAQTQRTILYEEFTGESCVFCAEFNPFINATVHKPGNFPNKIVKINFQGNIPEAPGAGSLYADDKTEVITRQTYYSVQSAPYGDFNGKPLPDITGAYGGAGHGFLISDTTSDPVNLPLEYPTIINDSAIVNAPFALVITHTYSPAYDSVYITAVITAAQSYSATSANALVLQIAMEEAAVHFAQPTGTNGEKDFYDVMRKMVPSVSGTVLNGTWANAATQTVTLKAKIPTYIHDKNQLAFVAFIQDNGTKRVHQAAYSAPIQVALDAATISLPLNAAPQCSYNVNTQAVISNAGTTVLTSCTINYKLDAGTASTFTWTGSLASGQTATVTIPTIVATTSGTHTVTVFTSNPNNGTDDNAGNNTKTAIVHLESATAAPAPLAEGFQGGMDTRNVLVNTDGTPTYWAGSTPGGYGLSTQSAIYSFYNNGDIGDTDNMYLPVTDLTSIATPQLRFDYAYNYYDSAGSVGYDTLAVNLSTDCGTTWNTIFYTGGAALTTSAHPGKLSNTNGYIPTSTEWKTQYIDLSLYASSTSVLIQFSALNQFGNNLYIDNINIAVATAAGIAQNHGNISNVKVYPNPASEQFNVNINLATSDKAALTIYNVMGQQVFTKSYELNTGANVVNIPADQLSSGIYTILVSSAGGAYQSKISIVK